jgi:hypothetical protein
MKPPKTLQKPGASLWQRLTAEFEIPDGLLPALEQLCCLEDRLSQVRAALVEQGVVRTDGRASDLLGAEAKLVGQWRMLAKTLGVFDGHDDAPQRRPGRPPRYGVN